MWQTATVQQCLPYQHAAGQALVSYSKVVARLAMKTADYNMTGIAVHAAGAGNDYQKDLQFRKLNEKKDQLEVKMMRGGAQILVPNTQIVVGDVIILQTGDKITADGVVIESHNMVVDEASLTGESEPIKKGQKDPFCRAGTAVGHTSMSFAMVHSAPIICSVLISQTCPSNKGLGRTRCRAFAICMHQCCSIARLSTCCPLV